MHALVAIWRSTFNTTRNLSSRRRRLRNCLEIEVKPINDLPRLFGAVHVPQRRGYPRLGLIATLGEHFLCAARTEHSQQLRGVQTCIPEAVPGATGHEYEVPGAGREDAVAGEELELAVHQVESFGGA